MVLRLEDRHLLWRYAGKAEVGTASAAVSQKMYVAYNVQTLLLGKSFESESHRLLREWTGEVVKAWQ